MSTTNLPVPTNQSTSTSPDAFAAPTPPSMIRSISQSAQEREIVKTAPDIIVYIEGLPYMQNAFVNDRRTNQAPAIVNINDYVVSFSCTYDTELMVPSGAINLQVPNHQKYLFQMPGGNNLIQSMMQVQVYAKGYFFASNGDTVYRRVFKGLVSHLSYNDNGKMYEISIQCYGILQLLEMMQINLNPSMLTAAATGVNNTIYQTRFAELSPYQQIAAAFTYGLVSDGFQLNNLTQQAAINGQFGQAVTLGYMVKWQAILTNLRKDVHIYGFSGKDNLSPTTANITQGTASGTGANANLNLQPYLNAVTTSKLPSTTQLQDIYYGAIQKYHPDKKVHDLNLFDNNIVTRLELIRKMTRLIDFEAYQDIDGKIIVKPPLYNLDVTNTGLRTTQTSTTAPSTTTTVPSLLTSAYGGVYSAQSTGTTQPTTAVGGPDRSNSYTNPLTQIYSNNNPFIIYLAEILTEQETEDQAAIKRTRMTVSGNILPNFQVGYQENLLSTAEWIDVPKLIRYGLREEPIKSAPWFQDGVTALYAHAIAETVRMNRGFRTYTVTIPLRPELKLGFPIFFPHRDMYGYVKSISINYQSAGTATMTVTCDSLRRRVLVNTAVNDPTGKVKTQYTAAPNLVLKRAFIASPTPSRPTNQSPSTSPDAFANQGSFAAAPGQSSANTGFTQSQATGISQGGFSSTGQFNPTQLAGTAATIPCSDPNSFLNNPPFDMAAVFNRTQTMGTFSGMATDQSGAQAAQYFIQNDGSSASGTVPGSSANIPNSDSGAGYRTVKRTNPDGYFTKQRPVDDLYLYDLKYNTVIPYTDDYGYELLSPFPWGRWVDLNTAIKEFTENGWVNPPSDVNGNPVTDPQELAILKNTDAFLYAGLGTPTSQGSSADALTQKFSQISNTIGGSSTASAGSSPNTVTPDATVLVLDYSASTAGSSTNDSSLLTTPQPEDNVIQNQINQTANSAQQLVNVLISGSISPVPSAQAALLATQTQTPFNTNSIGSTPSQKTQQALIFSGTPVAVTNSITPTPGGLG